MGGGGGDLGLRYGMGGGGKVGGEDDGLWDGLGAEFGRGGGLRSRLGGMRNVIPTEHQHGRESGSRCFEKPLRLA